MLSDELITKIAAQIEAMPPRPASRREIQLLITRIEAKIRAAQERGCTYAEIAKQITESGYPIKTSTLRVALQRHRKKEGTQQRTARRKVSTAPLSGAGSAAPVLPLNNSRK